MPSYKYLIATNPKDVDALCGYACMHSTLGENYEEASNLYRLDTARNLPETSPSSCSVTGRRWRPIHFVRAA